MAFEENRCNRVYVLGGVRPRGSKTDRREVDDRIADMPSRMGSALERRELREEFDELSELFVEFMQFQEYRDDVLVILEMIVQSMDDCLEDLLSAPPIPVAFDPRESLPLAMPCRIRWDSSYRKTKHTCWFDRHRPMRHRHRRMGRRSSLPTRPSRQYGKYRNFDKCRRGCPCCTIPVGPKSEAHGPSEKRGTSSAEMSCTKIPVDPIAEIPL